MRKPVAPLSIVLVAALLLSGCNYPRPTPTSQADPAAMKTFAVQTAEVIRTQYAATSVVTQGAPATEAPTSAPAPTEIAQVNTQPPAVPTNTQPPAATATAVCDQAGSVKDVTIPDGATMTPGQTFTKTWELKNTGSCTWNANYSLVFANEGNIMNGPASKPLTSGTVAPGQTMQVSVELKAPTTPGTYRGYWQLRNPSGVVFGTGPANNAFWVEIKVSGTEYNFVDNYCSATWNSGTVGSTPTTLACNGNSADTNGFIIKLTNPAFGSGHSDDEATLWLNPPLVENGEVRGIFPAIAITSTNRFRAIIGCQSGASACDVKFLLNYKADGGAEQTLAEWSATSSTLINVNQDLSSLAGKSVQFILVVRSNGPSNQDQALWLQPRITP